MTAVPEEPLWSGFQFAGATVGSMWFCPQFAPRQKPVLLGPGRFGLTCRS